MTQHKKGGLKIVKSDNKTLSKEQKAFNRLTKRIENLQKKIIKDREKLDTFLDLYAESIPELTKKIGDCQIETIKIIDASTEKYKYTKGQKDKIKAGIMSILNELLEKNRTFDEDLKKIHDRWTDDEESFDEIMEEQTEMGKDMLEKLFKEEMGINVDLSDIDLDLTGDMDEIMRQVFQKIQEQEGEIKEKTSQEFEERQAKRPQRKKTKKQLEKEQRDKETEKAKLKSVRNIYVSLAKVLHPDTASNDEEAIQKEELMKRVTEAYDKKDLPTLLQLEMEWVATEQDHLESLSGDKLKLYIETLKEQIKELEMEKNMLYSHPKYMLIQDYIYDTLPQGKRAIKERTEYLKYRLEKYRHEMSKLSKTRPKQAIIKFVNDLYESIMEQYNMMSPFDMLGQMLEDEGEIDEDFLKNIFR